MNLDSKIIRKIVAFFGIFILAVIATIIYLLVQQVPSEDIYISDVVARNLDSASQLSSLDKPTNFFTGTSISSLDLRQVGGSLVSREATKDIPFFEVHSIDYNSAMNTLVANITYRKNDLYNITGYNIGRADFRQVWITQKGKENPQILKHDNEAIIDAHFIGNKIVILTSNGVDSSLSIGGTNNDWQYIKTEMNSNQIIGVLNDEVVLRDQVGKTILVDVENSSEKQIDSSYQSVIVDDSTQQIVVVDDDHADIYKDSSVRRVPVDGEKVVVSSGYIFEFSSSSLPSYIVLTSLDSLDRTQLNISPNFTEQIKGEVSDAFIVAFSPLRLGVVVDNDSLHLVSSDASYIRSVEEYVYPFFNIDYVDYDLGNNTALIYSNKVDESLIDMKSACLCDINQVIKLWLEGDIIDYDEHDHE